MKRIIQMFLVVMLVLPFSVSAAELEYTALYVGSNKAFVNDVEKQIDMENPKTVVFTENDRAYVPVRFISENYGGVVSWDDTTETAAIKFPNRTISLTIGKPEIIIDGKPEKLDTAPIVRNDRTFLPLRACTEAIGKQVFYSKGLILISDIENILDEKWDADIVDLLITYFD